MHRKYCKPSQAANYMEPSIEPDIEYKIKMLPTEVKEK